MSGVTIEVKGLAELAGRLRQFGPKLTQRGLRSATLAGAKVIDAAWKETAPIRTGFLQSQIIFARRRTSDPAIVQYAVVIRDKPNVVLVARNSNSARNRRNDRVGKYHRIAGPAVYGRFVEFGTSSAPAHPFARPALLANVQNALDAIKAGLERAVERAARST